MVCPHCGANNVEGETNCSYCRSSLTGQETPAVTESEVVTNNTPVMEEKPKKNHMGFILLVLGLIVIGVGVFIIFTSGKNNTSDDKNPSTPDVNIFPGDFTLAVLGQENHGKTSLTSAITKKYGDFKDEETLEKAQEIKVNGVTYNASVVEYKSNNRTYTLYDFPTDEDIKTALTPGNLSIVGAILVVDATQGPMTQTREHIELLEKMGVERMVIFINNCDKVSDEDVLKLVETEMRELLNEYHFNGSETPVVMGSSELALQEDKTWEEKIDELVLSIDIWIIKSAALILDN